MLHDWGGLPIEQHSDNIICQPFWKVYEPSPFYSPGRKPLGPNWTYPTYPAFASLSSQNSIVTFPGPEEGGAIRSPYSVVLLVWNMFIFPIYWECHHPNWLSVIFFRGVAMHHQPGWIALVQREGGGENGPVGSVSCSARQGLRGVQQVAPWYLGHTLR